MMNHNYFILHSPVVYCYITTLCIFHWFTTIDQWLHLVSYPLEFIYAADNWVFVSVPNSYGGSGGNRKPSSCHGFQWIIKWFGSYTRPCTWRYLLEYYFNKF